MDSGTFVFTMPRIWTNNYCWDFFPFLREGGTSSMYLWTRFVIFRFVDLLEFVRLEIIFFFLLQAFVLASDAHFM